MIKKDKLNNFLAVAAWPVLFASCVAITAQGFAAGHPVLFFNLAYAFLIICLLLLERSIPFAPEWNDDDGQTVASIAHTLTSKGTVQALVAFSASMGLATLITSTAETGYGIWPRDWPLWAQIIAGVYAAEFGLYWGHRLAHIWWPLWRFHAVHHSVTRLWIVNTGRFHFIDSLKSILLGMAILLALGAPVEVLIWLSAITAFIGMMTHCNVAMKLGPLNYIVNTPDLHRWHHSRDLTEANRNFSENIMLWDMVFGTWYNPARRPPVNIGINEYMPPGFGAQLLWPFRTLVWRVRDWRATRNERRAARSLPAE